MNTNKKKVTLVCSKVFSDEDDTYYYYDVELDSFSFFAIGEKVVVTDEGEEVGVSEERETPKKTSGLTLLWILIGVLILIAIGWGKKKKKSN